MDKQNTQTVKYWPVLEKNEILTCAMVWMSFEGIIPSEISQLQMTNIM
jgi:hypothetical protein